MRIVPKCDQRVIVGQRFGRLTVAGEAFYVRQSKRLFKLSVCQCDCGTYRVLAAGDLLRGFTTSCGCYRREQRTTHGMYDTPLYICYWNMRQRCENPKNKDYRWYGRRGISVCKEWIDFDTFKAWALANGYGEDLQIDRENNNGNYEPGNCRFVTAKVNANNRRLPQKGT